MQGWIDGMNSKTAGFKSEGTQHCQSSDFRDVMRWIFTALVEEISEVGGCSYSAGDR